MPPRSVAEIARLAAGGVVATLYRLGGDLDLAEDAYVDAAFAAFERWPEHGVPADPRRWLTEAACASAGLVDPEPATEARAQADELTLMVACSHPALALDARVTLMLRLFGGLTTAELGAVFLTTDDEITERLDEARARIHADPPPPVLPGARLDAEPRTRVLAVVHLVFATGHHAPATRRLARIDLAEEGIRLARRLTELVPDDAEVLGLLALELAVHARRATRLDDDGNPLLLPDADRARWDPAEIAQAGAALARATTRAPSDPPGPYRLQAEIACLHATAPTAAATDWTRIAECYRALQALAASPFVTVNLAAAEGEAHGAEAGLAVLDAAHGLDGWHLFHATRADLLERAGRADDAAAALREALAREPNDADRLLLAARLTRLEARDPGR